jgi:hypothetical protein
MWIKFRTWDVHKYLLIASYMQIGAVKATIMDVNEFTSVFFHIYLIWLELNLTFKWPVLSYAGT